jgi:nucleotide-binding universal stress UspA family protein
MLQNTVRTLVVGLDFSPYSKLVLKQAVVLKEFFNAKLVFVYAVHEPMFYGDGFYPYPYFQITPEKEFVQQLKSFYQFKGPATYIAKYGRPADVLIDVADRFSHSMIVAGYKGHNQIAEFLFGSTANEIALKAKVPVWIHRGNETRLLHRLLFNRSQTARILRKAPVPLLVMR